jgi:hypothetical protein
MNGISLNISQGIKLFNSHTRLLSCGHTFCESCLISILEKSNQVEKIICCPNCMTNQNEITKSEDIKKLTKNFNLLRIIEKLESNRVTDRSSKIFFPNEKDREDFSHKDIKTIIPDQLKKNYSQSIPHCKKHSLPIHSYAIGTNLLFCTSCEKETNLKTYPLPSVYEYSN